MSGRQLKVSQRNLMWLFAVIAVGLVAGLTLGWKLGLAAAVVVLVISEGIERVARKKRSTSS
jgi:uncharacterized membrane protein YhiD involved in acid resistance